MLIVAICSFIIWIWLFFFHGRFWSRGPILYPFPQSTIDSIKDQWPDVYIIIPARNEAETIERVTNSLLYQDYAGKYKVIVVDDESTDLTGDIIQNYKNNLSVSHQDRLDIIKTKTHPKGWSGKLWALSTGIKHIKQQYSTENSFFFFTDADIEHDSVHLTTLVCKALTDQRDQVSEMVQLRCKYIFEKAFIPAFVYFFCMLYPFSKVNKKDSIFAAGAGGTVLIRDEILEKIDGIAALKTALIDDVTLASLVKKSGGNIYLGHSSLASSLRTYKKLSDIWNMITRTAYVQLSYSLILLLFTVILMSVMWFAPLIQMIATGGVTQQIAIVVYSFSICSFIPTLSRFHMSFLWIFALPFMALFYLIATIGSAFNYYRGKGMVWKGRAYTTPAVEMKQKKMQLNFQDVIKTENIQTNHNVKGQ